MSRFRDAVLRVKNSVKNTLKISNVYDCVRPILLVLGIIGVGATSIRNTEGVYTLHNSKLSYLVTGIAACVLPAAFLGTVSSMFAIEGEELYARVAMLITYFSHSLIILTTAAGYIMSLVSCKPLHRVFQIIHNIDRQLETVNIRVKHWHITLAVTVLVLGLVSFAAVLMISNFDVTNITSVFAFTILFDLFYAWVILFLLVIQERFKCLNKVLQKNATVTNFEIIGERSLRDNYMLRRIVLARHVHEQLTEAVQMFTDSCRYVIVGLLLKLTIEILLCALYEFRYQTSENYPILVKCVIQIIVLLSICQANKNERRVLSARLRHLIAFETNRGIIQQVRQYIMYNAYCTTGLVDFQFTDVDYVLLLTIIDVIASNMLIIYSYNR